ERSKDLDRGPCAKRLGGLDVADGRDIGRARIEAPQVYDAAQAAKVGIGRQAPLERSWLGRGLHHAATPAARLQLSGHRSADAGTVSQDQPVAVGSLHLRSTVDALPAWLVEQVVGAGGTRSSTGADPL